MDIVAAVSGNVIVVERFARTAVESGRNIVIAGEAVPIDQDHFLVSGVNATADIAAKQRFEAWLEEVFE
ncbi:hypothetical protein [Ruegeria denitrificans]|uniref:hypothetical protein n=1 Tax=Ruegeria denitrificans TaxID=1715692 RepID=UPI00103944B1|nr:hypothetical protein [Ruegeria denitrificans]